MKKKTNSVDNLAMKDITKTINKYRECARSLWNTYFLKQNIKWNNNKWDARDEYEEICGLLFSSLVLGTVDDYEPVSGTRKSCCRRPLHKKALGYEAKPEPIPILRVVPSSKSGVPIHINRGMPRTGYWDHPLGVIKPTDADSRFIDFFDFAVLGFRDFQYVNVRIVGSDAYPEIIGRDALLGSNNVKYFLTRDE